MDDADAAIAYIVAECETIDDLTRHIMKHALIVQHLVCRMGKEVHQSEAGIRTLYADWADMAVEQFDDPRVLCGRKFH